MATLEQILAGLVEFRDEVYSRFDTLDSKIDNLEMTTYHICTMCHGAGEITPSYDLEHNPPSPIPCPGCNGAGRVAYGSSSEGS